MTPSILCYVGMSVKILEPLKPPVLKPGPTTPSVSQTCTRHKSTLYS